MLKQRRMNKAIQMISMKCLVARPGPVELAGSLLLANNNFYRQFTGAPQVTGAAVALPQMLGNGWVRDCAWSKRWDSSTAGRLAHVMKKAASCARSASARGRFDAEVYPLNPMLLLAQRVGKEIQ